MISAALLAGGKSRRMGHDKCLLDVNEVPLWQRQCALLQNLSDDVMVAAQVRPDWVPDDLRWISDAVEECGPLGGLGAALKNARHPLVIVLAVDLPEMTLDYLRALVARSDSDCGVVPVIDGLFQPLAAVYPITALAAASSQLHEPDKSLQRLVRGLLSTGAMKSVAVEARDVSLFRNFNSPAD